MSRRPSGPNVGKKLAPRVRSDPVAGLAGSIAHDFSNLLIVIRNASAFLRDDLPADHPLQEYVVQLLEAGERAAMLTRQLQAIGQSQLLSPEFVRPGQVIRELSDSLRRFVPEDVDLRMSVRSRSEVSIDVAQFQVAVISLVTYAAENARSHSTVVVAVNEETFTAEKLAGGEVISGRFVTLVVARPGVDGDTDGAKRMFEPRLTGKALPRGTDLRLATVRGIVSQSGGYVSVSSDVDHSTVFRVYLPIVAGPKPEAATKPRAVVDREGSGEVILLVEDDHSVRTTVRAALEHYGYVVVEARDGGEAQRLMSLFNVLPELILTDLVMPNVTGRELIEGLALEGQLPKVLLMSGYTDDDLTRIGSATQTHPFIRKPFTHDELARKVREVLNS
jgi:two-component system cell cycle sensor histidine kinase/response regulator CckA